MEPDRKIVVSVRAVTEGEGDETNPQLKLRRLDGPVDGLGHPVWAAEVRCPVCPSRPVLRIVNVIGSAEHVKILFDCPECSKLAEIRFLD